MARRSLIARALVATALVAPVLGIGLTASPAHAAARVTVANAEGEAVADPTYATEVTLTGSGFQSLKGGFGGVYVGFGTVEGNWRPSQGGKTGVDYWYVPDSEEQANQGLFKFIAYAGSDTSGSANGGTVGADGSWKTTLTIPGSSFQALDRNGKATTIDCLKTTCGVITFGAHGIINGANESFTPVKFEDLGARVVASEEPKKAKKAKKVEPKLEVDRASAVAGRALTFTAQGLTAGEQVVVNFDDGMAAVGPLLAGASGEVAGVVPLPAETASGTHSLKLTAAASGLEVSVAFAVRELAGVEEGTMWVAYAFVGGAALLAVLSVTTALVRRNKREPR